MNVHVTKQFKWEVIMSLRKKHSTVAVIMTVVALFTFTGTGVCKSKATELVWESWTPKGSDLQKSLDWYLREVEKRSGNRIKFKEYWGGSLVSHKDSFNAIITGIADAGTFHVSDETERLKIYGFIGQPFLEEGLLQANLAAYEYAKSAVVKEEIEKFGVVNILPMTLDKFLLYSTKPIRSMEDLKSIKLWVPPTMAQVLSKFGIATVFFPVPELYEAMQRGTIDATLITRAGDIVWSLNEVSKYIYSGQYGMQFIAIAVNKNKFDSLPKDIQKVFFDVADEYVRIYPVDHLDQSPASLAYAAKMEKRGLKIEKLPQEVMDTIINEGAQPIFDKWINDRNKEGIPGQKYFDEYIGLLKKYRE